jgi:hypothetical protein
MGVIGQFLDFALTFIAFRTGKMPVPQLRSCLVERASSLFLTTILENKQMA